MKTRIFIFVTLAFALSACKDNPENRALARKIGLECINGWVFQTHTEYPMFGSWKTTLTPLNVECPSGKVEIQ